MYFKYKATCTPQKCQKKAEIKNIPYFLPVAYTKNEFTLCLCTKLLNELTSRNRSIVDSLSLCLSVNMKRRNHDPFLTNTFCTTAAIAVFMASAMVAIFVEELQHLKLCFKISKQLCVSEMKARNFSVFIMCFMGSITF